MTAPNLDPDPDPDDENGPAEPDNHARAGDAARPDPAGWLPHPYRLPAARRIGLRRRQELAAFWLQRLGRPVTTEAVDALTPVAGRYPSGSYARQEADKLLRGGHTPHPSLVQQRLQDRAARDAARAQAMAAEQAHAATDLHRYRDEAITVIARWHDEHDRGPTWSELSGSLGWTRAQTEARLQALKTAATSPTPPRNTPSTSPRERMNTTTAG